jgi:phosphoadenosine phosphosulfate reductase
MSEQLPDGARIPSTDPVTYWQDTLPADSPYQMLKAVLAAYDNIALSFSGAEDVVLVHMAAQLKPGLTVFTLDTGRLHPETHTFLEKVRQTYDIQLKIALPDAAAVAELVNQKGLFSFYEDGHKECCSIRKVAPLRQQLQGLDAWITGQRKDQSPGTRQEIPIVQADPAFSSAGKSLIKFNPLANWTSEQVWLYIHGQEIPYNSLHKQGYVSIGCQPCTRPVLPGQHEREGRWWWETQDNKECGLHSINTAEIKPNS